MGHGTVHPSYSTIPLDAETFQELNYGFYVFLCIGVRLQEMEKQEILAILLVGVVDVAVWYSCHATALDGMDYGAIAREIKEDPG